ncbi:MAG: response regulator, partial [Lachnospiraceae bacterium]|nr:response regulator [Lachnospiraceae bacterium]
MFPKKQILVVEDNPLNREILIEILAEHYLVLEAENGQEALEVLKEHADSVALILLDVMMPVMDGFTFLDYIKADDELALIPVIVMTQSDSESDEV